MVQMNKPETKPNCKPVCCLILMSSTKAYLIHVLDMCVKVIPACGLVLRSKPKKKPRKPELTMFGCDLRSVQKDEKWHGSELALRRKLPNIGFAEMFFSTNFVSFLVFFFLNFLSFYLFLIALFLY